MYPESEPHVLDGSGKLVHSMWRSLPSTRFGRISQWSGLIPDEVIAKKHFILMNGRRVTRVSSLHNGDSRNHAKKLCRGPDLGCFRTAGGRSIGRGSRYPCETLRTPKFGGGDEEEAGLRWRGDRSEL